MNKIIILAFLFCTINFAQDINELNDLAIQYYNDGDYENAIKFGEQSLKAWEDKFGKDDSRPYAIRFNNLALFY